MNEEALRLSAVISTLRSLLPVYAGRTLENIIQGLEARRKYINETKERGTDERLRRTEDPDGATWG